MKDLPDLLTSLSKANVGCFVSDSYAGTLAYGDDQVLIAPSASARHKMLLSICDNYALNFHMSFNAQSRNVW